MKAFTLWLPKVGHHEIPLTPRNIITHIYHFRALALCPQYDWTIHAATMYHNYNSRGVIKLAPFRSFSKYYPT